MRLSDFKFKLPEELIAQFPSRFRDEARMMVLHAKSGEIEHKVVTDLAKYFDEGDLVINPKKYPEDVICINGYNLGKTVFLTKEEAEQKLKEMRGE
jgi:S-adenosylmethionine:tRNA ribosyltransferase-isomerase